MQNLIFAVAAAVAAMGGLAAAKAASYDKNYAHDRAEIEDLQARYLFALDWQDADAYASTFTQDGILDWAGGIVKGRDAIRKEMDSMRATMFASQTADASARPTRLRHNITNIVIKIEGNHATGRAYWFEVKNDGPDHAAHVAGYGHYEDEMQKVNGQWLFKSRKIYNEQLDDRRASTANPAW